MNLIPNCNGSLLLAQRMKQSGVAQITEAAYELIRNVRESALLEREQWQTAVDKTEELLRAFGENSQVRELCDHMKNAVVAWTDCVTAYDAFLSNP